METIVQSVWTKSKLLFKGLIIGILVLLLMIPAMSIQDLIQEREQRQKVVIAEVSSKWAGPQQIAGPILVIPYWQMDGDTVNKVKKKHLAYFLPNELNMNAAITPEEKHRGIYKIMLYTTRVQLSGSFSDLPIEKLQLATEQMLWSEAYVQVNISDVKGLNDEFKLQWNKEVLTFSPDEQTDGGKLIAPLLATSAEQLKQVHFSADLVLSGSEQLLFAPVGKSTTVQLSSKWPHPSFTGTILPQATQVKDNGFTATWKSLSYKRNFPQQWKDNADLLSIHQNELQEAGVSNMQQSFGVNLFIPVNNYQKTMRSVKYATLCILLTFAAFFLIETINKKSVHPFQYGLIGLALLLFYTLLLSFSEYIGFNMSYVIASVCTIGLITWFVKDILGSSRLSMILSLVLMLMYTYVFTTLQMQDYSLILGSLGLFITLAIVMYYAKKIQW